MARVAIVGAGLVGRSWAMVFARAGWEAVLYDPVAGATDAALGLIATGLQEQARHGLVSDPAAAHARVSVAKSLAEAVRGCDYVQESGPEDVEAKRRIWAELDALAPRDVVMASSTSAIVASRFTEELAGRTRCLVGHPVNPPHLVPLVEVSPAPWTSPESVARAREVYAAIGQVPITIRKETEGFILNRLQATLLAEAFRLVAEGYVSAADLDKTIKDGLGLRWSFMGPFETIELNAPGGIPDYCARYGPAYGRVADAAPGAKAFSPETVDKVVADWGAALSPDAIRNKSQWRDERLAALIAHKRGQKPA